MDIKNVHIVQGMNADGVQHAGIQTTQRLSPDCLQQENVGDMRQQTAQDAGQIFGGTRTVTADAIAESQAVCSKLTDAGAANNPVDGKISSFQDSQELGTTTWQDDEHEYETQMNLLNEEWKRPEVNKVMTELLNGELPLNEAADQISVILGHEITIASIQNRVLHCSGFQQSKKLNNEQEREDDSESGINTVEKHKLAANKFGPGLYEVIRNLRGNLNNIAIKEPQSNCVRIYRRSTTRNYYSYYRCSTCDHLSRREVQDAHPSPIIKMVHDNIVGEPFPSHYPECKPITLSQLRAMQVDRENRQEVINEMLTPFEAWSRGHLRALLEEARKASQLARQRPQWKKVRCRSRNDSERSLYGRPYGETLVSYEEKLRKRLNEQIKRPDSCSSSVISERFGAQTPTDDEWSIIRRNQDCSAFITDESQSLPDADGLLSEERAHIKQSSVPMEVTTEMRVGKVSSASKDSEESLNDSAGVSQITVNDQTSSCENGTEAISSVGIYAGISKAHTRKDLRSHANLLTDDTGRGVIRETSRKLFMVDDDHLLKLFRRCPDCGEKLKTLALSSRKAIPMVTYKCQGTCEERMWCGYEPK